MENILVAIGEFLAVDMEDVAGVQYLENDKNAIKILLQSGDELLLKLSFAKDI